MTGAILKDEGRRMKDEPAAKEIPPAASLVPSRGRQRRNSRHDWRRPTLVGDLEAFPGFSIGRVCAGGELYFVRAEAVISAGARPPRAGEFSRCGENATRVCGSRTTVARSEARNPLDED